MSTRGATIKLKIIKNYENGQVKVDGCCWLVMMWCSKCRTAIDPPKREWLMAQLSCRSNDDAALNENLFYAICDQVD